MRLLTKYQDSGPCSFRKKISCFHYTAFVKHVTPGAGHFLPKGHNLNKLCRDLLDDATYQILRLQTLYFQTRRF